MKKIRMGILVTVVVLGCVSLTYVGAGMLKEDKTTSDNPWERYNALIKSRRAAMMKVLIREPGDVAKVRKVDVLVLTEEPDYLAVIGYESDMNVLQSMGLTVEKARESDRKTRRIKIWVETFGPDNKDFTGVEPLRTFQRYGMQLWWGPQEPPPRFVYGFAYDMTIKALREKGYNVETWANHIPY